MQGADGQTFNVLRDGLQHSGERDSIARDHERLSIELSESSNQAHEYQKRKNAEYNGQPNVVLNVANKVYVRDDVSISEAFKKVAKTSYDSEVQSINFAQTADAARKINEWIDDKTHGQIKEMVQTDCINDSTRMLLVNSIYFKAFWSSAFDRQSTVEKDFWLSKELLKKTKFMENVAYHLYADFPEHHCTALGIRYKDSGLVFMILRPNAREGLTDLEENLTQLNLTAMKKKMSEVYIHIAVPKFKIDATIDLKNVLAEVYYQ